MLNQLLGSCGGDLRRWEALVTIRREALDAVWIVVRRTCPIKKMNCNYCQKELPPHLRLCRVCSHDNGFPNVRAAIADNEATALNQRYQAVLADAKRQGTYPKVLEFENIVASNSKAVLARSLRRSVPVLLGDSELFLTFYYEVEMGIRNPEDNEWDPAREAVDSTLFPYYHNNIHFAALAVDTRGASYYGAVSMVLKEDLIRDRASVFEENSRRFVDSNKLAAKRVPPGHRADWARRHILAVAKLGRRITDDAGFDDFCDLLLGRSGAADSDFIEVHIYQPLHRMAVDYVYLRKPQGGDIPGVHLANALIAALSAQQIPYEVEP